MRSGVSRACVALCAFVVALVPNIGRAGAGKAPALDVQQYPLQNPDPSTAPTIFVADGAVWSASAMDAAVRRVDPAAGPLVGYLTPPVGPYVGHQLADGVLWSVVVDPNGAPCAAPRHGENPELPYVLRGVDVETGATAALVPLGWCQWYTSRTLGGSPFVSADAGAVWVSRQLPPDAGRDLDAESVRVDAATGVIAPVAAPEPVLTFAAFDDGAWGMSFSASDRNEVSGYSGILGTHPLTLAGADASVMRADALRGAYWDPSTLAQDAGGVWVASAARAPRFGGTIDPILTRVTTAGRIVTVAKVRPWSIVTGDDGRTWFLGTTRRVSRTNTPQPVAWVLGRVDTRTGEHLRTYHLELGSQRTNTQPSTMLLAATGGSVWLRTGSASGVLVRVSEKRP
jgi:hypothetical protein